MLQRLIRLIGKLFSGKPLTYTPQSQERWNTQFRQKKWDFMLDQRERNDVIARIAVSHGTSILDVGCGNGALAEAFGRLETSVVYEGIDISEEAIKRAREVVPQGVFHVQPIEGFTTNTRYDVIVLNEVLYYIDYRRVMADMAKLLTPDGVLVVSLYQHWRNTLIGWWLRVIHNVAVTRVTDTKGGVWNVYVVTR